MSDFLTLYLYQIEQYKDKECQTPSHEYILCCCSSWHAVISRSRCHFCVLALRVFVLSYAIHFWIYLSQREVKRTDLASQNHTFAQSAINSIEKTLRKSKSIGLGALYFVSRLPICDAEAQKNNKKKQQKKQNKPCRIKGELRSRNILFLKKRSRSLECENTAQFTILLMMIEE